MVSSPAEVSTASMSSTPSPPETKTGARSQPPAMSWSSNQSPSSSSRSDACIGVSAGAWRTFLTNSSCAITSFCSCAPASLPDAIMASLLRMPATRSRSASAARPAAAAGLLSSWVSPAESLPSASNRSRSATWELLLRIPSSIPSSRCIAMGNHCANSRANSLAGNASTAASVIARTDDG